MNIPTRIIKPAPGPGDESVLREIAGVLRSGGVMAYPTDTFYGLGGDSFLPSTAARITAMKRRGGPKPLPVVVADEAQALGVAAAAPSALAVLAAELWPGPLTLVLAARPVFPPEILGPGGTIALRVPALEWLRALLRIAGFPIISTSANLAGEGELDEPEAVIAAFDGQAELIIDGGRTPGGAPSTIVDLTEAVPRLLRPGAIPWARVQALLEKQA